MNKKHYIEPTTHEIRIETVRMMAGSDETMVVEKSGENAVTDVDDILSRRSFSVWEEE